MPRIFGGIAKVSGDDNDDKQEVDQKREAGLYAYRTSCGDFDHCVAAFDFDAIIAKGARERQSGSLCGEFKAAGTGFYNVQPE